MLEISTRQSQTLSFQTHPGARVRPTGGSCGGEEALSLSPFVWAPVTKFHRLGGI